MFGPDNRAKRFLFTRGMVMLDIDNVKLTTDSFDSSRTFVFA